MNALPSAAARRAQVLDTLDYYAEEKRFKARGLSTTMYPDDLPRSKFECSECGELLQAPAFPITPNSHLGHVCRRCRVAKKVKTQRENKGRVEKIMRRQMEITNGSAKTPEDMLNLVLKLKADGWTADALMEAAAHLEFLERRFTEAKS